MDSQRSWQPASAARYQSRHSSLQQHNNRYSRNNRPQPSQVSTIHVENRADYADTSSSKSSSGRLDEYQQQPRYTTTPNARVTMTSNGSLAILQKELEAQREMSGRRFTFDQVPSIVQPSKPSVNHWSRFTGSASAFFRHRRSSNKCSFPVDKKWLLIIGAILAVIIGAAIVGSLIYNFRQQVDAEPNQDIKSTLLVSVKTSLRMLDMSYTNSLDDRESTAFRKIQKSICNTVEESVSQSVKSCSVFRFKSAEQTLVAEFGFQFGCENASQALAIVPTLSQYLRSADIPLMMQLSPKHMVRVGLNNNLFIDPTFPADVEFDYAILDRNLNKLIKISEVRRASATAHGHCKKLASGNAVVYIADPEDRSSFVVCDGADTYRMACGKGLQWNALKKACLDPNQQQAEPIPKPVRSVRGRKSQTTTTTTTTTTAATKRARRTRTRAREYDEEAELLPLEQSYDVVVVKKKKQNL